MKSIFKLSALALLATAMTVSCEREMDMPEEAAAKTVRTFTCVFAQPDSKVAVTDEGKSTWEVGDQIMVHGNGSTHVVVTLTADDISADGKEAVITVEGVDPYDRTDKGYTSMFYAQYPAALSPEGTFYYDACFSTTNDLLMAACDVDDTFVFVNLCGVISYKVAGEFDKVVFAGNNDEVVGYTNYQARVYATAEGVDVRYTTSGNIHPDPAAQKTVEAAVAADGATVNHICLPAGAKFSGGFIFKFYDGEDLVKVAKTQTAVEVGHGQILALGDISAHLEDYVPPTTSDHKSEIKDAQDLSSAQANCYVITAPGAYKFPALKGNSTEAAGNVFGVELVWESYNNAEEVAANSVIAAVDFEDNWIYFKTPDTLKPGNAMIAAKDADKKIIWSWHIWVPSTTITTNTYGIYNKELMDRNLGALVAATFGSPAPVESFGLTYQWGRKDPFVSPAATSGSANATVAGTAPSAAAGQITVGESIANPTALGHVDDGDWLTAPDNTLWQNDEKTIYDPCPAGYRVPARDKEQLLMSSDLSAVTGWSEDATNGYVTIGNPQAILPVAGYRDDYSVDHYSKIYQRVAYWTSYASSEKKGNLLNIRLADYGNAHALGEGPKARGGYIRCAKMEDAPVAPTKGVALITAQITSTDSKNPSAYEGELDGAVVSYVNGNNAYIEDATGAILLYMKNHGLTAGDVLTGPVSGTGYIYNGMPEITSLGQDFDYEAGGTIPETVLTIEKLLGDYDANVSRRIRLEGVTVTDGISDGDRNGAVSQGESAINVYAQLNNKGLTLVEGKTGDLICFPTYYKEAKQVSFWDNAFFEVEEPAHITIDGDLSDWDKVKGDTQGNHTIKVASDENFIYFYSHRTTAGRYGEIWGGSGYVYIAFDLDGDDTTGETLWGNGPYEFVGVIYPYGEQPTINAAPGDACLPEGCTLANVVCKGVVDDEGAKIEFSVPRADIPAIPTTPVTLYSWGNKDLNKVTLECTL